MPKYAIDIEVKAVVSVQADTLEDAARIAQQWEDDLLEGDAAGKLKPHIYMVDVADPDELKLPKLP